MGRVHHILANINTLQTTKDLVGWISDKLHYFGVQLLVEIQEADFENLAEERLQNHPEGLELNGGSLDLHGEHIVDERIASIGTNTVFVIDETRDQNRSHHFLALFSLGKRVLVRQEDFQERLQHLVDLQSGEIRETELLELVIKEELFGEGKFGFENLQELEVIGHFQKRLCFRL